MFNPIVEKLANEGIAKAKEMAQAFAGSQADPWQDLKENPVESIRKGYESIREKSQKERETLFGSMWEIGGEATQSWFHRQFPFLAKIYGGYEALSEEKWEEKTPWEHELQILGAFSVVVPDFLLRFATDPLKEHVLLPILESGLYPHAESILDNLYSEDDPDQVVDALLTMNQDIVTGKVTMEGVWQHLIQKAL